MSRAEREKVRLESWKEVATFFGRDERTVRRWEAERGLPIRRLPGGGRSRIFAHVVELERWRDGGGADAVDPGAASGGPAAATGDEAPVAIPRRAASGLAWPVAWLVTAALCLTAAIGLHQARGLGFPMTNAASAADKRPRRPPPLQAQKLYIDGMNDWARRTPVSLARALEAFNNAIRIDPDYADAYVGLADSFNLLREFTLLPDSQAYPLARSAARRAVALDETLPEAHAALAFADFWGFGDADTARREFHRALALDPRSVNARHWYATFLSQEGDGPGAIREIDRAMALDPTSKSIRADRGELLYIAGRRAEGVAALEAAEAADPTFLSPHRFLGRAYLVAGRDDDFLRESAAFASLTGDRSQLAALAAVRRGFARAGRRGMLEALLTDRIAQSKAGVATAYSVAEIEALLGDAPRTDAWLRLSLAKHDGEIREIARDASFDGVRDDPAFRAIAAQPLTE